MTFCIFMLSIGATLGDDDVVVSDQEIELALNKDVEKQICDAIDPRFLLQLVFHLLVFMLLTETF